MDTSPSDRQRREANEQLRKIELRGLLRDYGALNLDRKADHDCRVDDLVYGVVGSGRPGLCAGEYKSGKTSLMIDLAVCVSAGRPAKFLGYFDVPDEPFHVCYLGYEGVPSDYRNIVGRVELDRGIQAPRDRLHVLTRFPALNDDAGLGKLDQLLSGIGEGLVIIDCLYAALRGSDFTRLAEIGGLLSDVTEVCRDNDSTPLFVHHFKSGGKGGLGSVSGAGVKEHVGQWILLHKTGVYDPVAGRQRLCMDIGSRAGYGGKYALEITEGRPTDPGGRVWQTRVSPVEPKQTRESVQQDGEDGVFESSVLSVIESRPRITQRQLAKQLKRSSSYVKPILEKLTSDGRILGAEVKVRGVTTIGYERAEVGLSRDCRGTCPAIVTGDQINKVSDCE